MTSKKSTSSDTHEAVFTLDYDDRQRARRVERSLRPELGEIAGERTQVSVTRDGPGIDITVTAEDLVALRAGMNTWLTLVGVAESAGRTDR